jgi:hypothetical protein
LVILFIDRKVYDETAVAKISAFEIPGLICWFWSHDHSPPHFHIKKAGCWEIKVYLLESTQSNCVYEILFPKRPGKGKPPTSKELTHFGRTQDSSGSTFRGMGKEG